MRLHSQRLEEHMPLPFFRYVYFIKNITSNLYLILIIFSTNLCSFQLLVCRTMADGLGWHDNQNTKFFNAFPQAFKYIVPHSLQSCHIFGDKINFKCILLFWHCSIIISPSSSIFSLQIETEEGDWYRRMNEVVKMRKNTCDKPVRSLTISFLFKISIIHHRHV